MSKKIMSLGGNYFQMTAVKAAKSLGYYVIDVDYVPNNPAHKYADEYHNISTLDKEKVLKLAIEKEIDGVISYASDVSACSAAWISEQMGLPTNPYKSVEIMTHKDRFHPFLKSNGFFVPDNARVNSIEDIYSFMDNYKTILIKPVNSSGSKGITVVSEKNQVESAFTEAMEYSRGEGIVAEEFLRRDGHQIAGDVFVVDGKVVFWGFANEHFNNNINSIVPVGESFPLVIASDRLARLKSEIERALNLLQIKNGAINIDAMFDEQDRLFIVELGPRNGGNLITDAIKVSTGVDLAEYTVKVAVGDDVSDLKETAFVRNVSTYIWHSDKDMVFNSVELSEPIDDKIILSDYFVRRGTDIHRYINGGFGIGAAIMEFDNRDEMISMMDHMYDYYKVV